MSLKGTSMVAVTALMPIVPSMAAAQPYRVTVFSHLRFLGVHAADSAAGEQQGHARDADWRRGGT